MLDFLTLKPEVFGLAISDSFLRIIKLKKNTLVSWGEKELNPGIIEKGELKKEKDFLVSLKDLLTDLKGEALNTNYTIVSLPEERSFLQTINLPEMEDKFLEKAVYFEAENYIPLKKEEACLDFEKIDKKEVLIAAYPKEIVLSFLTCFKKIGLIVKAIETESQAIARALIKNNQESLIIDFQRNKIVLLVYSKKTIRFACTLDEKSLIDGIKKSLVYCKSKNPKIILNNENEWKEKIISLGFSVQIADPWINVFPNGIKEIPKIDFKTSLNYSTAIGLALRGIKKYD